VPRLLAAAIGSLLIGLFGGVFVGIKIRRWRRRVLLQALLVLRSRRLRKRRKILVLGLFAVGFFFAVVGFLTLMMAVL